MDIRRNVLEKLEAEFKAQDVAAILVDAKEYELPGDVLTVMLDSMGSDADEVMFEMAFMPQTSPEDPFLYFLVDAKLEEDMITAFLPTVYEAVANFNTQLPIGSIGCNGNEITMKFSTIIPGNATEDAAYALASALAATAISTTNLYVRSLLRLSEGRMDLTTAYTGLME